MIFLKESNKDIVMMSCMNKSIHDSNNAKKKASQQKHIFAAVMFEDWREFEVTPRVALAIVAFLVSTILVLFTQPNIFEQRRSALAGCKEQIQKVLKERHMHALLLRLACQDAFSCNQFQEHGTNGRCVGGAVVCGLVHCWSFDCLCSVW